MFAISDNLFALVELFDEVDNRMLCSPIRIIAKRSDKLLEKLMLELSQLGTRLIVADRVSGRYAESMTGKTSNFLLNCDAARFLGYLVSSL